MDKAREFIKIMKDTEIYDKETKFNELPKAKKSGLWQTLFKEGVMSPR